MPPEGQPRTYTHLINIFPDSTRPHPDIVPTKFHSVFVEDGFLVLPFGDKSTVPGIAGTEKPNLLPIVPDHTQVRWYPDTSVPMKRTIHTQLLSDRRDGFATIDIGDLTTAPRTETIEVSNCKLSLYNRRDHPGHSVIWIDEVDPNVAAPENHINGFHLTLEPTQDPTVRDIVTRHKHELKATPGKRDSAVLRNLIKYHPTLTFDNINGLTLSINEKALLRITSDMTDPPVRPDPDSEWVVGLEDDQYVLFTQRHNDRGIEIRIPIFICHDALDPDPEPTFAAGTPLYQFSVVVRLADQNFTTLSQALATVLRKSPGSGEKIRRVVDLVIDARELSDDEVRKLGYE